MVRDKEKKVVTRESTILMVKVIAGARSNRVIGWEQDRLKIALRERAEKGKANKELLLFLAKHFHIRRDAIEILSGEFSNIKRLRIFSKKEDITKFKPPSS